MQLNKRNKCIVYIAIILILANIICGCSSSNNVVYADCISYEINIDIDDDENNSNLVSEYETEQFQRIMQDEIAIENIKNDRKETEKEEEINRVNTINLVAVGDNLIHMPVLKSGLQKDGSYDYNYMYENIKGELEQADLRAINQETIFIKDENRYSSYPCFGSPYEIGDALLSSGFNLITCATNHSYDKSETGIRDTLEYWEQHKGEADIIGIYDSQEDYDTIKVIEVNGIKIACLNYTYGLNGFVLPSDKQYLVKTLYDEDSVAAEIQRADELSDFVIVFPHWGTEYVYKPTSYQKNWAKIFADNGADLIIGTHPHVVEPLEYITANDGRIVPCYYSLGNFISGQNEVPRNLGGMAKVIIKKDYFSTTVEKAELIPIVTHRDSSTNKFSAYLLTDYSDELASNHWLTKRGKTVSVDGMWKLFNEITNP